MIYVTKNTLFSIYLLWLEKKITQQTYNVSTTSLQRRCNVTTLQRRCNDVGVTLCVYLARRNRIYNAWLKDNVLYKYTVQSALIISNSKGPGPDVIKHFSCSIQLSMKISLLINMKMPTIVDIFSSPELCSGWAIVITFRPSSVRPSVNIFKRLLLWSRWTNFAQISYGASWGCGNERLLKWSRSVDQDGRHAHIW